MNVFTRVNPKCEQMGADILLSLLHLIILLVCIVPWRLQTNLISGIQYFYPPQKAHSTESPFPKASFPHKGKKIKIK